MPGRVSVDPAAAMTRELLRSSKDRAAASKGLATVQSQLAELDAGEVTAGASAGAAGSSAVATALPSRPETLTLVAALAHIRGGTVADRGRCTDPLTVAVAAGTRALQLFGSATKVAPEEVTGPVHLQQVSADSDKTGCTMQGATVLPDSVDSFVVTGIRVVLAVDGQPVVDIRPRFGTTYGVGRPAKRRSRLERLGARDWRTEAVKELFRTDLADPYDAECFFLHVGIHCVLDAALTYCPAAETAGDVSVSDLASYGDEATCDFGGRFALTGRDLYTAYAAGQEPIRIRIASACVRDLSRTMRFSAAARMWLQRGRGQALAPLMAWLQGGGNHKARLHAIPRIVAGGLIGSLAGFHAKEAAVADVVQVAAMTYGGKWQLTADLSNISAARLGGPDPQAARVQAALVGAALDSGYGSSASAFVLALAEVVDHVGPTVVSHGLGMQYSVVSAEGAGLVRWPDARFFLPAPVRGSFPRTSKCRLRFWVPGLQSRRFWVLSL